MDEFEVTGELTPEQGKVLFDLAGIIADNNMKEQEAVRGYNTQLAIISKAQALFAGRAEVIAFLDALEAATREKISDELSHSRSLNTEYTEMTGIQPAED